MVQRSEELNLESRERYGKLEKAEEKGQSKEQTGRN